MSLVGKLEELPLPDLLHLLSLSKRTGLLTVETNEGKHLLIFKDGVITNAASSSPRIKSLGELLIENKRLSQVKLDQVLDLQKVRRNEPLGSILLESGAIDKNTLQQTIQNQIHVVVENLKKDKQGSFRFEVADVKPFDDIHYDPLQDISEKELAVQPLPADEPEEEKLFDLELEAILKPAPKSEDMITYGEIQEIVQPQATRFTDLHLPERIEMSDVPFEEIADRIDFPSSMPTAVTAIKVETKPEPGFRRAILLAEDEALTRRVLAVRLQERGFEVFQSDNATDALRLARELLSGGKDFWIVTDLVMPGSGNGFFGGLEIVETMRKINSAVPILMISDYQDTKAQTRAFSLGVFHFHKKPPLSKTSIKETESQLYRFADMLVDVLNQPSSQSQPLTQGKGFWDDLGLDRIQQQSPLSIVNMMRQLTALREKIEELQDPEEIPEISPLILRYAAQFFDRALLFRIEGNEVKGFNGFGDTGEGESMLQKVGRMKFSLTAESIFFSVIQQKKTHIGKLADTPVNRQLISLTGRLIPPSIAILPFLCREEVIALLYGDNAVSKRKIKDLEGLEILLVQAGLAMENAFLHRKIRTIQFR